MPKGDPAGYLPSVIAARKKGKKGKKGSEAREEMKEKGKKNPFAKAMYHK